MSQKDQDKLGKALWDIASDLRGAMNADSFRDYMLSFLFLRYLSHNYEESAKKELGRDYPKSPSKDERQDFVIPPPLEIWYKEN
jgi:type I restriction enzyme M protein